MVAFHAPRELAAMAAGFLAVCRGEDDAIREQLARKKRTIA